MENRIIKIAVLDDHPFVGEGLSRIIMSFDDLRFMFYASCKLDLYNNLKKKHLMPSILLLDIDLKGEFGIDILEELKTSYPELSVVMFSFHEEPYLIIQSIQKGASGYIKKNSNTSDILYSI